MSRLAEIKDRAARFTLNGPETDWLIARVEKLETALGGILGLIESGFLVRDISRDGDPGFVMRMIEPLMKLKTASQVMEDS